MARELDPEPAGVRSNGALNNRRPGSCAGARAAPPRALSCPARYWTASQCPARPEAAGDRASFPGRTDQEGAAGSPADHVPSLKKAKQHSTP
jgi:hypothetical protein